jgi:hypothetical protein
MALAMHASNFRMVMDCMESEFVLLAINLKKDGYKNWKIVYFL